MSRTACIVSPKRVCTNNCKQFGKCMEVRTSSFSSDISAMISDIQFNMKGKSK